MYPRRKGICLSLLISLFPFLLSCSQGESVYLSFPDMFPYLTKAFETETIDFGIKEKSDEHRLGKGWSFIEEKKFRWAIGEESNIVLYLTEMKEKFKMECRPFNPRNQPAQVAKVYVNDNFLQEITFTKRKEYSFHIASNILQYGSNHITFEWKYPRAPIDFRVNKDMRKLTVWFSRMWLIDENRVAERKNRNSKIAVSNSRNYSNLIVPPGGVVEYYVDLPEKPMLTFGLSTEAKFTKPSRIRIAIYNEEGKAFLQTFDFKGNHSFSQKKYKLNLKRFAKETVKIAFLNSINNDPSFVVSWVNPKLYSFSGEGLPSYWEEEKVDGGKKEAKSEQVLSEKPNVFIYLVDTLRADHLRCYGYERETSPFIDEFSKDAVLFKKCFANASWTKSAVGSILTGLYPNKHRAEERKDRISSEVLMISEILKSIGYATIYVTTNGYVTEEFNFNQGNDFYTFPKEHAFYGSHTSKFVNTELFKLVEYNPDLLKKPIFAYLHTLDPHDPYAPEEPFTKFQKIDKQREDFIFTNKITSKKAHGGLSKEDINYILSLYDCEILYNDYFFGEFVDFLKEKDLYENSIIIFISDHGEQFDEHGSLLHGHSIYNEEIHVPLLIKFLHGEFSGCKSDHFVSQVDIVPTILDYLGLEISSEVDGISLLRMLEKDHITRTIFIKENLDGLNFVGFITTVDKMKHIIWYKNKSYTLLRNYQYYDLNEDFHEKDNLFDNESLFSIKSIKFKTDYVLKKMEKSAFKEEERIEYKKMDPAIIKILKALGYIR